MTRGDDGAGVFVVQRLMEIEALTLRADIKIFDAGTAGMEILFQARGSSALIVIDANFCGEPAGTIYRVSGAELMNAPASGGNLHDFRWDHAIYAGRQIFKEDFPTDIIVFLIEAENVGFGLNLSAPVLAASLKVVDMIVEHLGALPQ